MPAAHPKPTYILSPTQTIAPNTKIVLGSILADPLSPLTPLNKSDHLPIPAETPAATFTQRDVKANISDIRNQRYGIWTAFLASVLGVGADMAVDRGTGDEEVYSCEALETVEFEPGAEYLARCMALRTVGAFVKRSRVRGRSVYMVTGVKIAKSSRGRRTGGGFKVGVDGSGVGVPVGGGVGVEVRRELSTGLRVGRSDDFVLAYKVVKVSVKRDGRIVDKEFNKEHDEIVRCF
ncbi:hypothetical protein BDV97DRAFT_372740 [Delphinella strobiligena]|nr:hypothetical protein BDV97DRAFT_372740 [Delphinella strobiligena]